ncbi:MAG: transporter substrate-binding domain-containing protein [Marinobacterium sp.]|nr:transporter substrate-binding domain-containing protein [Marinobacterium sp.]
MERGFLLGLLLSCLQLTPSVHAANCSQLPPDTLKVGLTPSPPFVIHDTNEGWQGLSVELWQTLASQLSLTWQFCDMANPHHSHPENNTQHWTVAGGLKAVQNDELDLLLGALTITSEREKLGDFSLPFFHTGLSIATRPDRHLWDELWEWASKPSSIAFVLFLIAIAPLLAMLIRYLERDQDQELLDGPKGHSFANTVLWVTLLCTGRAGAFDMKSFTARVLATLLSFAGITVLASLVAVATSSTVMSSMDKQITSLSALSNHRVAVMEGTSVQQFLKEHGIRATTVPSVDAGLKALMDNKVDAVVHDRPVLQYNIHMLPADQRPMLHNALLNEEFYSFYLQQNSTLLEQINQALPETIADSQWQTAMNRYLGAKH